MFFIGATGQLLTLILTVCLPFIFFLSGDQSINISNSSLQIEVRQIHLEVAVNDELSTISQHSANSTENMYCSIFIENRIHKKIPIREFNVKREPLYADSSGNKAPPVFHCFC